MKVLATGARGQTGRELVRAADRRGMVCIAAGRNELDITDTGAIAAALGGDDAPDVVINLAAYTRVDGAEAEPDAAFRVNATGAGNLALACARTHTPLVHVSTDYVFDGDAERTYSEQDPVRPLNVYGASKEAGEREVRRSLDRHLIVRTSWIFAAGGSNFVTTMLRLAGRGDEVRVVADETGCPTGAATLADTLLDLAERTVSSGFAEWGTYHFCGRPAVSRADFARAIFDTAAHVGGLPIARVKDIASAAFPTPAKRPRHAVLDCARIERVFGIGPSDWRPCLERSLRELARHAGE